MASGSKVNNVYTDDPGDRKGKSVGMKKDGDILSPYSLDNVHGYSVPNPTGDNMGGGPDYMGHSLKGTSAVQRGPGSTKQNKSPKIANH